MSILRDTTFSVGKYLVSPLTRRDPSGAYLASVSIRSGHGSGTHDRVLRFSPQFATHESAVRFATEQGLNWLRVPSAH